MSTRRGKAETARRRGRSPRGNSSDATGKFSVRERRATVATSISSHVCTSHLQVVQFWSVRAAVTPLRALETTRVGSGGRLSNTDGLRKDPILGVEKQGDACVVKLAGE